MVGRGKASSLAQVRARRQSTNPPRHHHHTIWPPARALHSPTCFPRPHQPRRAEEPWPRSSATSLPARQLLHVRRLRGGLSADVHSVELQLPSGDRRKFVVRRHRPGGRHADPSHTERESRLLSLLWSAGVPVPELILADAAGAYFGTPMLVTAFAGHPLVQPRKPVPWAAPTRRGAPLYSHHQSETPRPFISPHQS